LLARRLVDDGHAAQRRADSGGIGKGAPLGAEHVEEKVLRRIAAEVARQQGFDVVAAGLLRARQQGVEQAAAGIGVDFDQLRARVTKMEVVAEEDPARRGLACQRFRRPAQTCSR
jgi:hypothetical protein